MTARLATRYASLLLCLAARAAPAQEPTFMEAATHPGRQQLYTRLVLSTAARADEVTEQTALLKAAYGLRPDLALLLDTVARRVDAGGHDDTGLDRVTPRLKYRILKHDLGPLNTWRASIMSGVDLPGGSRQPAPRRPAARAGITTTAILGRHGLNGQVDWSGLNDRPDTLALNASHLYRLAPGTYDAATQGAWYTMLESLTDLIEGGAVRSEVAAGILYEARQWAAEISLRLPAFEDDAPERHYGLAAGVRYLF